MIPFIDLKAQYQSIREDIEAAVSRVLESGQFILGEEVQAFEHEFAEFSGVDHAVAVNSGTSALHLALLAAGIGSGDEVITVPFTFVATAAAICYVGARPVFVDIEPRSLTMDVNQLQAAVTERTRAIIPVHLYGQPADMDPILEVAGRNDLVVIEDACQAHGSEYKGRRVGGIGDLGCFSFYPGKNLGAYGEGGILVTNDSGHAQKARMLRDWGQKEKGVHQLKGFNYRMDGIQGAILRVKLRRLEDWTESRRSHAALYNKLLSDCGVGLPEAMDYSRHVYHIYAIRSAHRDGLRQALDGDGVQTGIHYPIPVHLQPAYSELGHKRGDFPHSEQAALETLSMPMYAELSDADIERVSNRIILHFER